MELERYSNKLTVILKDGSHSRGEFTAEEILEGSKTLYVISLTYSDETKVGESEDGFFDALRKLRIDLEKSGALLCCYGASENVYPSPMQRSMGNTTLAYRMSLGKQALSKDIVNIFDSDDTIKPSTVEVQRQFYERWLNSL